MRRCLLPRAWGDRRSEVKEEGRIGLTRSVWEVTRPGGHERSRSPHAFDSLAKPRLPKGEVSRSLMHSRPHQRRAATKAFQDRLLDAGSVQAAA